MAVNEATSAPAEPLNAWTRDAEKFGISQEEAVGLAQENQTKQHRKKVRNMAIILSLVVVLLAGFVVGIVFGVGNIYRMGKIKQINLGDDYDAVEKVLGSPIDADDTDCWEYRKGTQRIEVYFVDGKVTEVYLNANTKSSKVVSDVKSDFSNLEVVKHIYVKISADGRENVVNTVYTVSKFDGQSSFWIIYKDGSCRHIACDNWGISDEDPNNLVYVELIYDDQPYVVRQFYTNITEEIHRITD